MPGDSPEDHSRKLKIIMTKYADDITRSIPTGPNVNDSASDEVENFKVWVEENLMKLNLSKTKERVIRGRTTLPPPDFSG